jgi:hypothetical protein
MGSLDISFRTLYSCNPIRWEGTRFENVVFGRNMLAIKPAHPDLRKALRFIIANI